MDEGRLEEGKYEVEGVGVVEGGGGYGGDRWGDGEGDGEGEVWKVGGEGYGGRMGWG